MLVSPSFGSLPIASLTQIKSGSEETSSAFKGVLHDQFALCLDEEFFNCRGLVGFGCLYYEQHLVHVLYRSFVQRSFGRVEFRNTAQNAMSSAVKAYKIEGNRRIKASAK